MRLAIAKYQVNLTKITFQLFLQQQIVCKRNKIVNMHSRTIAETLQKKNIPLINFIRTSISMK